MSRPQVLQLSVALAALAAGSAAGEPVEIYVYVDQTGSVRTPSGRVSPRQRAGEILEELLQDPLFESARIELLGFDEKVVEQAEIRPDQVARRVETLVSNVRRTRIDRLLADVSDRLGRHPEICRVAIVVSDLVHDPTNGNWAANRRRWNEFADDFRPDAFTRPRSLLMALQVPTPPSASADEVDMQNRAGTALERWLLENPILDVYSADAADVANRIDSRCSLSAKSPGPARPSRLRVEPTSAVVIDDEVVRVFVRIDVAETGEKPEQLKIGLRRKGLLDVKYSDPLAVRELNSPGSHSAFHDINVDHRGRINELRDYGVEVCIDEAEDCPGVDFIDCKWSSTPPVLMHLLFLLVPAGFLMASVHARREANNDWWLAWLLTRDNVSALVLAFAITIAPGLVDLFRRQLCEANLNLRFSCFSLPGILFMIILIALWMFLCPRLRETEQKYSKLDHIEHERREAAKSAKGIEAIDQRPRTIEHFRFQRRAFHVIMFACFLLTLWLSVADAPEYSGTAERLLDLFGVEQ